MTRETKKSSEILSPFNPMTYVRFTKRIHDKVGFKFTLMLSSNYYITKGLLHMLLRLLLPPWFKNNGASSQATIIADAIALIPWSMKGFFGVISDNFALMGYYKTSYLQILSVIATISAICLAVTPDDVLFNMYQIPAILIFFIHSQASAADLFCEGKYVTKMKQIPEMKGDLILYVWSCQLLGGFPSAFLVGPFSDKYDPKWLIILVIPFVAQQIPLLIMGCMVDDKSTEEKKNKWDTEKFKKQWKIMALGITTGLAALTLALFSFTPLLFQAIGALAICGIVTILTSLWMKKIIAGAIIYLFCTTAFNLSDGGTSFYWIIESNPDCLADGPQFSFTFLLLWGNLVGLTFQLLGLWAFNFFIVDLHLRTMFWTTNSIQVLSSVLSILLYTRSNLELGISDHVFYMLTSNVLKPFFYMMNFIPCNLLIAKMCPKDVEVTVYAILAGFSNFGQNVSAFVGTYFSEFMGVKTIVPCNWDNFILQQIIIALIPLIEIPLTFLLIPKGKITDDFLGEKLYEVRTVNEKQMIISP